MKIILLGCSGFIGISLTKELLQDGHEIIFFTRSSTRPTRLPESNKITIQQWNGTDLIADQADVFNGADAVINLCGEGIANKRWSTEQKERIRESRIQSTRAVVNAIHGASDKPKVLINASAIGYYGNVSEDRDIHEDTSPGDGFLADTCKDWESEAAKLDTSSTRLVLFRIGVVLEKGGGALSRMIPPFQMFIGGPLGSGKQWFPWVHRDDIVGMIKFLLERNDLSGPINAVAPNPLQLKEFCTELGKAMNRPSWAPVPGFVLKVMLGELSSLLLNGVKVVPSKLSQAGYQFRYPTASQALDSIMKSE